MPEPHNKTNPRKVERIMPLHRQGLSASQIGDVLGMGKTTVRNYIVAANPPLTNREITGLMRRWR